MLTGANCVLKSPRLLEAFEAICVFLFSVKEGVALRGTLCPITVQFSVQGQKCTERPIMPEHLFELLDGMVCRILSWHW